MTPAPATPLDPKPTGPPLLIFNSRDGVASKWRLLFFLALSLIGHVGMFYLFKVVTPTTTKRIPPQEEVIVLRSSDPSAAAVLRSLEDRSPASLLFSAGGRNEPAALPPTPYVASYEHYRPSIRQDWSPPSPPLLYLAEGSRPVLPQMERPPEAGKTRVPLAAAIAETSSLLLKLPEALKSRGIMIPPKWPADLIAPDDSSDPYQFQLAINADGTVRYCLSDGMSPPPGLVKALANVKFTPRAGAGLQWADVEVSW